MLAVYHLRFYELDQTLVSNTRGKYKFLLDPYLSEVEKLEAMPTGAMLIFDNFFGTSVRTVTLDCTIDRIFHHELGDVLGIFPTGFSYVVRTRKEKIQINAEEDAGTVESNHAQPSGWIFIVELQIHNIVKLDPKQAVEDCS